MKLMPPRPCYVSDFYLFYGGLVQVEFATIKAGLDLY